MKKNIILLIIVFSSCTKTEYELLPPQLEVVVTDIDSKSISGANVSLFLNQDDWEQGINKVTSGITNVSGSIVFEDLIEEVYFFAANKDSKNNNNSIVSFETALKKGEKKIVKTIIQ